MHSSWYLYSALCPWRACLITSVLGSLRRDQEGRQVINSVLRRSQQLHNREHRRISIGLFVESAHSLYFTVSLAVYFHIQFYCSLLSVAYSYLSDNCAVHISIYIQYCMCWDDLCMVESDEDSPPLWKLLCILTCFRASLRSCCADVQTTLISKSP